MFHYNSLPRDEVACFETPYTENLVEVYLDDRSVNPTGDPKWSPVHCVMPGRYREFADRIRNFTVYEDDVWIVTFPKAGTTWTQEMVWLIDHDLDYETASNVGLKERSVYLELFTIFTNFEVRDTVTQAEQMPRPRHIKSHLPLALLPKQLWTVKPKLVYTTRNPKDIVTSLMHHYKYLQGFKGSREDFFDGVLADRLDCCPMVKHVTEFWRVHEHHGDHVLFLHFEDMKRDLPAVIRKVCDFFGKKLSDEQVEKLQKHLSFDSMKANDAIVNRQHISRWIKSMGYGPSEFEFFRKGQVGGHKEELPKEFIDKLDSLINEQLVGTGFQFRE